VRPLEAAAATVRVAARTCQPTTRQAAGVPRSCARAKCNMQTAAVPRAPTHGGAHARSPAGAFPFAPPSFIPPKALIARPPMDLLRGLAGWLMLKAFTARRFFTSSEALRSTRRSTATVEKMIIEMTPNGTPARGGFGLGWG
jgi:hypothetical protein